MKVCVFVLLLFGFCNSTLAQIELYKENGIEIIGSVECFLEKNNFDYALVVYSTSNLVTTKKIFSGLLKQRNSWYIVQISEATPALKSFDNKLKVRPLIKQKNLTLQAADSLLKLIKPNEGMKYSQDELSALPLTCCIVRNDIKDSLTVVSDAPRYFLVESSSRGTRSLTFYSPKFYIDRCLPYDSRYNILSGMVNTFDALTLSASSILK